jgi:hypothetical protein
MVGRSFNVVDNRSRDFDCGEVENRNPVISSDISEVKRSTRSTYFKFSAILAVFACDLADIERVTIVKRQYQIPVNFQFCVRYASTRRYNTGVESDRIAACRRERKFKSAVSLSCYAR